MNTLIKYLSLLVFLVIINLSIADLTGIPQLPEYILKLNNFLVILAAFAYGYGGWKIIKQSKDMQEKVDMARIRERKIAEMEGQYQDNIEKLQKEVKEATFQFSAIFLKIRDLMSARSAEGISNIMMEILEKGLNTEKGQLFFRDGSDLYIYKNIGMDDAMAKKIKIPINDSSIVGWCVKNGQLATQENINQESHLAGIADKGPVKTLLCVPLMVDGNVIGAINIERFGNRKISKNDRLLLSTAATLAGVALQNANAVEA